MPEFKRAEVIATTYSRRWRWRLRANPALAVERSRIDVGRENGYCDRFRVVRFVDGQWLPVSDHVKKRAAITALRKFARRQS